MDSTDKAPDPTQGRIPDLIKIGEIPSSYGQTLYTDIVDPVTINDGRCRFTLSRVAGFLHSNSKITLAITPSNTADAAFFPLNVGVSQLIKSATLTIGNKTVCSVDDYANFHAYQSLFISPENNKEREQFLSQRAMAFKVAYDSRSVAGAVPADTPPNSGQVLMLDQGRDITYATNGTKSQSILPFQEMDASTAQLIEDTPTYSVYLSDLFPFLRFNQLPMFMIDDEVHIDLVFADQTTSLSGGTQNNRCCVTKGAGQGAKPVTINQSEVKLVYDSILYDGEVMDKYRQQNPTLSFQYVDYRLAKRTGTQAAFSQLTFPVGGNGRLCSKVIFSLQNNANFVAESLLHGISTASAPNKASLSVVNLRYNNQFEFSEDLQNPAQLFSTTQAAEGKLPMTQRDMYQRNGVSSLSDEPFEGSDLAKAVEGLGGNGQFVALRPNRAERINNQGIDLVLGTGLDAGTYTLRVYLELLKVATLKDGAFDCYFA
tara:strand:+ start:5692 stop:7149 length:1458 start_codon:yes stop_codon:yes gene_type:complete